MGLKPDRRVVHDNTIFFMNQVATRGGVVCISTVGSGAGLDQSTSVVHYDSTPSGATPVGVLLQDVVNKDLTQTPQNLHKDEVQLGSKVAIVVKGEVVTNMLASGITVSAGDSAYLGVEGLITNVNTGAVASPKVGKFYTAKDEDGYARVQVDL